MLRVGGAAAVAALLAAFVVLFNSLTPGATAAEGRPNVVFLLTDDQVANDLSVMDDTQRLIAGRGVKFKRAYANDPLCCPSRATFFTGQYMHNHGVTDNDAPDGGWVAFQDHEDESVAPWLDEAGYRTIHIGKYLNGYGAGGNDPTHVPPGWDRWHAYVGPGHRYYGYTLNHNGEELQTYGEDDQESVPPALQDDPENYQTDVYRDLALDEIEQADEEGGPFYLSISFTAPHVPSTPPVRHANKFQNLPLPTGGAYNEGSTNDKPQFLQDRTAPITTEQKHVITQKFRAMRRSLVSVDGAVEKIVQKLKETGLLSNTYVVFASDNGFYRGQHRIQHGKVLPYQPAAKIPFLIRGPGIPKGKKSNELVSNADFVPSVLRIAGATSTLTPAGPDGRSLLRYAEEPILRSDRPLLLEAASSDDLEEENGVGTPPGLVVRSPEYHALRTRRWLYVEYASSAAYPDGAIELYDMKKDPYQLHSKHAKSKYAGVVNALQTELARLKDCSGSGKTAASCTRVFEQPKPPG